MTTKTLENLKELHRQGFNDRQVASLLGVSKPTVEYWRWKLGISANNRYEPQKYYTIYDCKDNVRAFGSAKECAEKLGIKVESVYRMAHRSKRNGDGRVVVE